MSKDHDFVRDIMEFGLDQANRRVYLQTEIGENEVTGYNAVELVTRALLYLDTTSGAIEFWINSPGGGTEDALAIHDVIRSLKNPVITVGHGQVSSAATLLLACGTGVRYVSPHCFFMHHEGSCEVTDQSIALQKIQIRHRARVDKVWADLMGAYTPGKKTANFWAKIHTEKPELYLDATQMIAHGVADEIWKREA